MELNSSSQPAMNIDRTLLTSNFEKDIPIYGNMNEGRIRKKNADRFSWKMVRNRNLRIQGKE